MGRPVPVVFDVAKTGRTVWLKVLPGPIDNSHVTAVVQKVRTYEIPSPLPSPCPRPTVAACPWLPIPSRPACRSACPLLLCPSLNPCLLCPATLTVAQENVAVNELKGTPFTAVTVLIQMPYERTETDTSKGLPSAAASSASPTKPSAGPTTALPDLGSIWMGHLLTVKEGTVVPPEFSDPARQLALASAAAEEPARHESVSAIAADAVRQWWRQRTQGLFRPVPQDVDAGLVHETNPYEIELDDVPSASPVLPPLPTPVAVSSPALAMAGTDASPSSAAAASAPASAVVPALSPPSDAVIHVPEMSERPEAPKPDDDDDDDDVGPPSFSELPVPVVAAESGSLTTTPSMGARSGDSDGEDMDALLG